MIMSVGLCPPEMVCTFVTASTVSHHEGMQWILVNCSRKVYTMHRQGFAFQMNNRNSWLICNLINLKVWYSLRKSVTLWNRALVCDVDVCVWIYMCNVTVKAERKWKSFISDKRGQRSFFFVYWPIFVIVNTVDENGRELKGDRVWKREQDYIY